MGNSVQMLILILIAVTAVLITLSYRTRRDRTALTDRVRQLGGTVVSLKRVKKGSPFPDTTRGWWAWRVLWRSEAGERSAWVLTTREGIKEWRD